MTDPAQADLYVTVACDLCPHPVQLCLAGALQCEAIATPGTLTLLYQVTPELAAEQLAQARRAHALGAHGLHDVPWRLLPVGAAPDRPHCGLG